MSDLNNDWIESDSPNLKFYTSRNLPIVQIQPKANGELIDPNEIIDRIAQWQKSGVSIELSGHFVLAQDMEFKGFSNLQIIGKGNAIIEQKYNFEDASPMALTDCTNVTLENLVLLGSGEKRSTDGSVSEQNGIRVTRSRHIHIEKCIIGPSTESGTIKHGISVIDDCRSIWVKDNVIRFVTGCGIIVGSGVLKEIDGKPQHPTDPSDFDGHTCENIYIEGNVFEQVGVAVTIDDRSVLCWVTRNRIRLHYGEAIEVEDGSMWFVVTDNICGPGRGPAVLIGHGQTKVWGSRGVVANNLAAGCNDVNIAPPLDINFYKVEPYDSAFFAGGDYVKFSNNIEVPGG